MNAKKAVDFLVLRSVWSKRNLSSLALVGFFMAVYYMSGGRISSVPRIEPGATFGGVSSVERPELRGDVAPETKSSEDSPSRDSREKLLEGRTSEAGLIQQFRKGATTREAERSAAAPATKPDAARSNVPTDRLGKPASTDLSDIKAQLDKLGTKESKN